MNIQRVYTVRACMKFVNIALAGIVCDFIFEPRLVLRRRVNSRLWENAIQQENDLRLTSPSLPRLQFATKFSCNTNTHSPVACLSVVRVKCWFEMQIE